MYNLLYRLWRRTQNNKLGATSYIPMPKWMRSFFSQYTIRKRLIMYSRVLVGSKVYRNVPPDVACANVVSGILEIIDPSIFGAPWTEDRINGTYTLSEVLAKHPRFRATSMPLPGSIILSATGKGKPGTIGHVGIVDFDGNTIMSNSSYTGTFEKNYTLDTWHKRYTVGFGIPPEYYIIIK